ncbi:hypothetical protein BS329_09655 [Amycolatopsis coloradensis]|uniref:Uncharacterized protein n=1 Tax=Amycolatopsis coloradensis TaxID=76021 RepID=A0A1R0KVQ1_9PSEU|nr:SAVMC3_10250 family protein [Amycolatopsis coloradensis]OLZ53091.1 hypothetical protein BS329_09655 [Amycolatopsis coloradensis]
MFRRKPPLRYYLYVSDAKLEMLFEQINPALRRRISAEAKVDLKLASLTLRRADHPHAARMAKLQLVERYIDKRHHVGTIQEPGREYFRGSMPMQWRCDWHDTALFRGRDSSHVVVLAGSSRHVLGERPAEEDREVRRRSVTPNILPVIAEHIFGSPGHGQRWRWIQSLAPRAAGSKDVAAAHDPPEVGLREVARTRLGGPTQHLEFLAVPIIHGPATVEREGGDWFGEEEDVHAVLATPLYVAMARNHADEG